MATRTKVTADPRVEAEVPANDDGFMTASIKLRGKLYRFRELPTDQYDKLVEMATDTDDMVDRTILLRLMVTESATEPKITPTTLAKMPYSVVRQIGILVNNMHWADEFVPPQDEEDEGFANVDDEPPKP